MLLSPLPREGSGEWLDVCAAPHPPAGTFSPYSDCIVTGKREASREAAGCSATLPICETVCDAPFSPSLYGEKCPVSEPDR
ncbi:hypothetical protein MES4922_210265 [Mesorhizobium ventifaucium]|uniref:Uncharacterized protein n=1 Tax=Mesorhizobium ventifaucium TaxID=666020 RepID=A0ABM9DRX4_9HYPH|nr:hypothetical protein MES4922_210265 [Mesorhizobium ventifaucium]